MNTLLNNNLTSETPLLLTTMFVKRTDHLDSSTECTIPTLRKIMSEIC